LALVQANQTYKHFFANKPNISGKHSGRRECICKVERISLVVSKIVHQLTVYLASATEMSQ